MTIHQTNPFLDELELKTRRRMLGREEEEFTEFTGEALENTRVKFVDKETFVKVLMKGLKQGFNLNRAGQDMWWVLISTLAEEGMGRDAIYLPYSKHFTFKDGSTAGAFSATRFYAGLESLRMAGFIEKHHRRGWYWVNPDMVWNGDRVRFVEEYRLKTGNEKGPKVKHPRAPKQNPDQGPKHEPKSASVGG